MPASEDFGRELFRMMADAQKGGRESIEVSARELCARVGPPMGRAIGCRIAVALCDWILTSIESRVPAGGLFVFFQGPDCILKMRGASTLVKQ